MQICKQIPNIPGHNAKNKQQKLYEFRARALKRPRAQIRDFYAAPANWAEFSKLWCLYFCDHSLRDHPRPATSAVYNVCVRYEIAGDIESVTSK